MKLETLFDWYRKQYQLPHIETKFNIQDSHAYTYCSARNFFAIVIPFQSDRLIIVEHLITDFSRFGWSLIGGSVNEDKREDFIDGAFNNTTKCIGKEILLEEFEPIATLENTFVFRNQSCKHKGVAFIARISDKVVLDNALRGTRCIRLNVNQKINVTNINNKKVLDIAIRKINGYVTRDFLNSEINSSYVFDFERHKNINLELEKKETELCGKDIILIQDFRRKILEKIEMLDCKKIIDIACGENNIAYDMRLVNEVDGGVWINDIAWNYIRTIHKRNFFHRRRQGNVIFTNHDAIRTPFVDGFFDLVFAKNLLHHLYSYEFCEDFIKEARRIARFLLLVEFVHPDEQTDLGKELHYSYYKKLLKEPENCYYVRCNDFKELTNQRHFIKECHYNEVINTVKGSYNVSLLEFFK